MKTIIVTEKTSSINFLPDSGLLGEAELCEKSTVDIIPVSVYLMDDAIIHTHSLRVFNFCQSYDYQSLGYYTSLLAEARGHKVFPSVLTIQDFERNAFENIINLELLQDIQQTFKNLTIQKFSINIYFGKSANSLWDALSQKLHHFFPMPLFQVYFEYDKTKKIWLLQKIKPLFLQNIPEEELAFFSEIAYQYFIGKKRKYSPRKKNIYFDLAILHNADEVAANNYTAPSNEKALKSFIEAGNELGIHSELIEKKDFKKLSEYDALFIRETTAVNHHTYRFARRAMAERLVVIDDPNSILKCTNKVYLAELLKKHHIPTPHTFIVSRHNYKQRMAEFTFPCVLKLPDGACSRGVKKVNDFQEMTITLKEFFKYSELILVQLFMPTEFDWRITIFDNKPLFACRYFMAKGHWQIYNWEEKIVKKQSGDSDVIPLDKVPSPVIEKALKATRLIGNGLYGVDLKEFKNKAYIIEINDNPSIDYGVEDELLGDTLYLQVMQIFLERMKRQRGYYQ